MCLITSACSCIICVIVAVNPSDGSGVAFGILWDLSWSAMNHWATADQLAKESGCFTLRPSKLLLVEPLHSCERNKKRISKSGKILYSHPWWMFFSPMLQFFSGKRTFFSRYETRCRCCGCEIEFGSRQPQRLRDPAGDTRCGRSFLSWMPGVLESQGFRLLNHQSGNKIAKYLVGLTTILA